MKTPHYYAAVVGLSLATIFTFWACNSSDHSQTESSVPAVLLLAEDDLPSYEKTIDHAGLIKAWNDESFSEGSRIYGTTCFNCHGNPDQPGSIPNAHKFWADAFKNGSDPYAIYQVLSRGFGRMPAQIQLVPREKYAVIQYIWEEYIKEMNPNVFPEIDEVFLSSLPLGDSIGPEPKKWQPWVEMNYGDFLIQTYELAGEGAPERIISGGPSPLPNEDYGNLNFAYKGIAIRLDKGEGGIAAGSAWALFDHDLNRLAGIWTGEGFIDWEGILLNDRHNIYPRTTGQNHLVNPMVPAWANPENASFEDPRFRAVDGRAFGPLPKKWTHYKGLYHFEDKVILFYTVGEAEVLDYFEQEKSESEAVFSRTLQISASPQKLLLRLAPSQLSIHLISSAATLRQEAGFHILEVPANTNLQAKILLSTSEEALSSAVALTNTVDDLQKYTHGGPTHYPQILKSPIIPGADTAAYAVDVLSLPLPTPWKSRMRPGGIDFYPNGKKAVLCTIEGEVWEIDGITQKTGTLSWKRIATGLFQPLGIKIFKGDIFVSCRDQIVRLHDLNGDGETDFYESFNNDHQVTEHFHEFAMGLQVDEEGNFYYAKSARHARTPLVPQHGTLLRVSADGSQTDIIANGFRAANGVCQNPDGSFYVTDQEGHWNPMNRINLVHEGGFYGNMYGYGAPGDTSDAAMISPLCWIDQKNDRSPSELVWADSKKWGPLNGSLLNLSYGYGKMFLVLREQKEGLPQGGIVELPIARFPTGIMRARFNPADGQMYACGMNAWGSSQVLQAGGLYRIRYTGNPLRLPVELQSSVDGIRLKFAVALDEESANLLSNYEVETWQLKRSHHYGSRRYDKKVLPIENVQLSRDGKTIFLRIPDIAPSWIMELRYGLKDASGSFFEGFIQNTIYETALLTEKEIKKTFSPS